MVIRCIRICRNLVGWVLAISVLLGLGVLVAVGLLQALGVL